MGRVVCYLVGATWGMKIIQYLSAMAVAGGGIRIGGEVYGGDYLSVALSPGPERGGYNFPMLRTSYPLYATMFLWLCS